MPKISGAAAALALVYATLGAAFPAPYTLEGSVSDRLLRTPVAGAEITLLVARRSVTSADDGSFQFGERPVQTADQLVITHPEYRTVRIPLGDLGTDAWHLDIVLTRTAEAAEGGAASPGGGR